MADLPGDRLLRRGRGSQAKQVHEGVQGARRGPAMRGNAMSISSPRRSILHRHVLRNFGPCELRANPDTHRSAMEGKTVRKPSTVVSYATLPEVTSPTAARQLADATARESWFKLAHSVCHTVRPSTTQAKVSRRADVHPADDGPQSSKT